MVDAVRILFALGLPWLTGALFVLALGRPRLPGQFALVAGLGLPIGLVGVIGGYLVLGLWGPGLLFGANLAIQLILLTLLSFLAWRRWRRPVVPSRGLSTPDQFVDLSICGRWLFGVILAWLAVRWLGVFVEVLYRPLFPWDAWYAYGMTAKVWFYEPQLDVVTGSWQWVMSERPSWAAGGTRHPPGIALIQLWSLQALGRYDDALMNLAWPMAMAATGLSLFGVLRVSGANLLVAVSVVAAILTLPVLNIQAVLAGYGDLWIGLFLMAAVIGIVLARAGDLRWLGVTAVAAAGMLMIKESGWLWMLVLLLGLACAWVRVGSVILLCFLGFLCFCMFLWLYGEPIRVSTFGRIGFSNEGFVFPRKINLDAWREIAMWPDLLRHMFVHRNWHLFWYLVPFIAVGSLWYARSDPIFASGAVVTLGGLALLLAFFSFSILGSAVIDGASVNRLLLHLVPTFGLVGGLVVLRWQGRLVSVLRS